MKVLLSNSLSGPLDFSLWHWLQPFRQDCKKALPPEHLYFENGPRLPGSLQLGFDKAVVIPFRTSVCHCVF